MVLTLRMESHFEEEDDQEWPEEEEMGATTNKQHDITAPGMSEIISVSEFRESCAGASQLEELQSPIPQGRQQRSTYTKLAQQMGITKERLKEIRVICE